MTLGRRFNISKTFLKTLDTSRFIHLGRKRSVLNFRVFLPRIKSKNLVNIALLVGNSVLFIAVISFIISAPKESAGSQLSVFTANDNSVVNPLDQLSSATIALTVARMTNLPEAIAINNQADSELALLNMAPVNNSVISKPQVVTTDYISNKDIKVYVVQPGDTVTSIAAKFNITSNSILWSNNISGNEITPGVKLLIPPVSGIVYTVKAGDTPASLAQKYGSNESLIVAYNDAEIHGIYPNEKIIIPNGTPPNAVQLASNSATYGWGFESSYGYNGYDFGYCTYWVAKLRAEAGDPLPTDLGNASTWAYYAEQFGIPVGTTPEVGAAVVMSTTADGGQGHVAYVEAVNPNGTITISEMNYLGWDIPDTRTVPSAGYTYIY